jgi:hypothetical protein
MTLGVSRKNMRQELFVCHLPVSVSSCFRKNHDIYQANNSIIACQCQVVFQRGRKLSNGLISFIENSCDMKPYRWTSIFRNLSSDSFIKNCPDDITAEEKAMLQTDFSTPQGHTGLAPVEMTECVILSGTQWNRRICMATTFSVPSKQISFCS